MSDYTILYIYGAGHSGSTLLNLLVNAHSQATGLSEIHFIERFLKPTWDGEENPLEHPFWQRVRACWEAHTDREFERIRIATPTRREMRSWKDADYQRYFADNRLLFNCVAEVSGSVVLVDTSKNRIRFELLSAGEMPIKLIHLVRDGRAVTNSYRRKYGSFMAGFRLWFGRTLSGPKNPHSETETEPSVDGHTI